MFGLKTRRSNLIAEYLVGAFVLTSLLAAGIWYAMGHRWTTLMLLLAWLISVNIAAFGYYGYDKWRAKVGSNRVPEAVLHTLTVAGGSIGSFTAMRYFRHKTIKGSFRIIFWALAALQFVLLGVIVKYTIAG